MTTKERYVSYEVAKLLKEKGFDWSTCYYTLDQKVFCGIAHGNPIDHNISHTSLSVPTQQMACRWLREMHKIDISVTPDDGSWWIKITELESWSCVFDGKVLNSDDIKSAYQGSTSTKEECYEAGLWYVLKNLI